MRNYWYLLTVLVLNFMSAYAENVSDEETLLSQIDTTNTTLTATDTTDKPLESYSHFTFTPKNSYFNVPIEIDVNAIKKTLNTTLTGLLYEDNNIEDDSLKIKVWKNGNYDINFEGNTLTAVIPLKIWAMKRIGIIGITHKDQEVETEITVTLQSKIFVSKNWGILTESKLLKYEWNKKPTTKFIGIDIPITYIVENMLEDNKANLGALLDNAVKTNLPTNEYAKNLWQQIQQPIPVNVDQYEGWIVMKPNKIYMKPIVGSNNKITTGFSIGSQVELAIGIKPQIEAPKALPECKLINSFVPEFELNLIANTPYSLIDTVAINTLKDQPFGDGKRTIYVDDVHSYGSNEKLAIKLTVHGFINGYFFLTGTPFFDRETASIRLKDVDYNLKSKNLLHMAIKSIFKPILKKQLEKKFELPMEENLKLIEQIGNAEILNSNWADNVFTEGKISKLECGDIHITQSGIQTEITVKGTLNVLYK